MRSTLYFSCTLFIAACMSAVPSVGSTLSLGYVSLDAYTGSEATFDITNLTGASAGTAPDMSFPVVTPVTIDSFSLVIDFQGGGIVTEASSQFSPDGSGGFTGNFGLDLLSFPISGALLTGTVSPTSVELNGSSITAIASSFSAMVLPSSGAVLAIGDLATLDVAQTPEPAYGVTGFIFLGALWLGMLRVGRRRGAGNVA